MEDSDQSRPPDSAQLSRQPQSDRVGSSEIVRRHFYSFRGKIFFFPRLRNLHRQLTSSVAASTSAVGIPFGDLDYVRTIRPWQNHNSQRKVRTTHQRLARTLIGTILYAKKTFDRAIDYNDYDDGGRLNPGEWAWDSGSADL